MAGRRYSEVLRERYQSMAAEKAARDRGEVPDSFLTTGLKSFDEKASLDRGILTVIGAPTGEGKSIFAKEVQEHNAKEGRKCLLLSFEDPPRATADRSFSTLTGINNARLGAAEITDKELARVAMALDEAEEWAENIEYHYGLKTPEQALEIVVNSDAELAQIDYAQAFADGDKGLERTIRDLAWALSEDAQEHNRCTIVYSQLKPQVEERGVSRAESSRRYSKGGDGEVDIEGFRPFGVSDLAWSSALGQRAKGFGFIFRPNRYRRRFGVACRDDRMELIWPKRNFGQEGTIVVGFDGETARLFDLEKGSR